MKSAFLLLSLWGIGMSAAELKVDHVTAAGKDVHAMQRALEAAGIKLIDENGGGPGVRLAKRRSKKS